MPLYLGIDGGGTKTTCAVGDDMSVLAVASGPGSNVIRLGEAQARAGLHAAISKACCDAGVSPLRVQSVCVGAAGATSADINATVKNWVRQVLPNAEVTVVGDMVIAMEATLHGHPGVIVISGTGSICYGRNERAQTARAGGWGFQVSDEGSGQWIGRTAVSDSLRAMDSARETILMARILQQWQLSSPEELVKHANSSPAPNFAELFPAVQQAADVRDPLAGEVLARAGAELSQLALIVLHRLWQPNETVRIGIAGGVLAHSSQVRRAFYNSMRAAWPRVAVCFQISEPVVGALWMARQSALAVKAR
ncbi:MAG TPA: BadF/BadG/BcrA/BcrD ATPase family protein [Terriglobales bacterium]|nr:BadF/BadG/BcrA/BcrD ATPase family protein [Terriglobales bacterium]